MRRFVRCLALAVAGPLAVASGPASAEPVRGSVALQGADSHYRLSSHDDGTRLVLLHGAFGGGDDMIPLANAFGDSRPVLTLGLRGHAGSSDIDATCVFESLPGDVAARATELDFATIDVMSCSLGGTVASHLVHRHPDLISHLVVASLPYHPDGWHEEVVRADAHLSPEMLHGAPIESNDVRLSDTPEYFDRLIARVRDAHHLSLNLTADQVAAIQAPSVIVVGDTDAVRPDHAVGFRAASLSDNPHVCHCRMCQKAAGSFFGARIGVRVDDMTWTRGHPSKFYRSDGVARGFAPRAEHPSSFTTRKASAFRCQSAHSMTLLTLHSPFNWGLKANCPRSPSFGTSEQDDPEGTDRARRTSRQHPDHDTDEWLVDR